MSDQTRAAAHAEWLAYATAELIRFSRKGPALPNFPFGLEDMAIDLVETLRFILAVGMAVEKPEYEGSAQLFAALGKWLSDNGLELDVEGRI